MSDFRDSELFSEMDTLVALHALDALEPAERDAVEAAVAADAELASALDEYRAVAAVLAEAVDTPTLQPSPDVWRGISAAIDTTKPPATGLAPVLELQRQRRWSRVSATIAMAAVLVAVGLAVRVIDLQNDRAEPDVAQLAAQKAAEPDAEVVTLAGAEGHAGEDARIVIGADGLGYVLSDSLPPLPQGRTYQLWAIMPGADENRVISAGVLGDDPGAAQFQAVGDIMGLAITDEIAGGVPVSEGETVALWLRDG
jgi:anti-sigma-K factor RskA